MSFIKKNPKSPMPSQIRPLHQCKFFSRTLHARCDGIRGVGLAELSDRSLGLEVPGLPVERETIETNRVNGQPIRRISELLGHLASDTVVHGIQDRVDSHTGFIRRLRTLLVDTRPHEDGIPVILGLLVEQIRAPDIRLRGVADEVHCLGRSVNAVLILSPLLQQAGCEFKGADLGLAEGDGVEFLALAQVLEEHLDHLAKSAHAQTHVVVGGGPDNVVVREVDLWALVEGLGEGADVAALGHGEIKHDLDIPSPVAGVGEAGGIVSTGR